MVVVNSFCLLYAFFLRPHCTGLAGLLLIEIKFYDEDNNVDDILLILCEREPASFWREKIAVVILLRVLETFKFKTRITTMTRFCQYLLVRTSEPASFWRTSGQTWQPSTFFPQFQQEYRSGENTLTSVRNFIILSEEGSTFFNKNNRANFSDGNIFLKNTRKNFK